MDFNITSTAIRNYQNCKQNKISHRMHEHNNMKDGFLKDNAAQISNETKAMPLSELWARTEIESRKASIPQIIAAADIKAKLFKTDVLHTAQQIKQKADTVTKLYSQGSTTVEGIYQREIAYDPKSDCEIMQETDGEGVILRESIFKDGVLTESVQYNDDGTITELKLSDGEIVSYKENLAKSDAGEDMDKYCVFKSGRISRYFEDYKEHNDGYEFVSKMASFENGKMDAYYEAMEALPSGSSTIDLHLRYDEDERIIEYVTDIKDGYLFGKKYILVDGKWIEVPPPEDE